MNNFEPQTTWTNDDARSKVERAHAIVAILYGIPAAFLCLGLLVSIGKFDAEFFWLLSFLLLLLALIFAHLKTKSAIENKRNWAIVVSAILMLLPLCAFPIGTIIAIYAYINIVKLAEVG